jgi:tetraacyldisaccharide 4'-kinase
LLRAEFLLSVGIPSTQETFASSLPNLQVPHISAALEPLMTGMDWADTRAFAFAGIGHPVKFFATVRGLGAEVVHTEPLDDHQKLSTNLLARFEADARAKSAQLVTTEKDAVRLPPAFRMKVITLPVRLKFEDDCALQSALKRLPLA